MRTRSIKLGVARIHYYGTKLLDSILFYGGKLAGRIIFTIQLIRNYKFYVKGQSYFPECELKSKAHIFVDQLLYILKTGEINTNYFLFGFDRKEKKDLIIIFQHLHF